ncbi:MAG: hypothetical protein HY319_09175 [Armatimonadetes bacterium]|nr:hypothetical protein [Armatimonadota bacterium]
MNTLFPGFYPAGAGQDHVHDHHGHDHGQGIAQALGVPPAAPWGDQVLQGGFPAPGAGAGMGMEAAGPLELLKTLLGLFSGFMGGPGMGGGMPPFGAPQAGLGQPIAGGPAPFGGAPMPFGGGAPMPFAGGGPVPFGAGGAMPFGGGAPFGGPGPAGGPGRGGVQQFAANPKGQAGMPLLPPNAGQDQARQVLEQRFGMPFDQIKQQYGQARGDSKMKKGKANDKVLNKIQPKDMYQQMMLESEFGPLTHKGKEGKLAGKHRPNATGKLNNAYNELYKAKGNGAAGGPGGIGGPGGPQGGGAAGGACASMSIQMCAYMTNCGVPAGVAMQISMCACGGGGDAVASGVSQSGVTDQAAYGKAKQAFDAAVAAGTPILLDLADEGVPPVNEGEWKPHPHRFTAKNKQYFDIDADGVKELVEWVNPGGALLCQPNEAHDVPNGRHLFGDAGGFKDGYEKLTRYDQGGKGYVDLADMEAANIWVWVDENGDAIVDEGELRTCRDLGVSRIYTQHTDYQSTFVHQGKEKKTWDWWPSYRKVTVGVR